MRPMRMAALEILYRLDDCIDANPEKVEGKRSVEV